MLENSRSPLHVATRPREEPPGLSQVSMLFRRHWRWFLLALATVAALVLAAGLLRRPVYTAVADVVVEPRQSRTAIRDDGPEATTDTNIVDTKVQMITSWTTADAVTRALHLDRDPEFARGSRSHEEVVSNVDRHLQVRRVGLTYVLNIGFSAASADKAARIANSFVRQSIDAELRAKLDVNNGINQRLNGQLQALRTAAEEADQRVQQYKIAHNLFAAGNSSVAEQQVTSIGEQIAPAEADRAQKLADLQAARDQLRRGGSGTDVSATLGSETISALRVQEADASRRLAELSVHYGDKHPEVVRAREQLRDVREQIGRESKRILAGMEASVAAANQRVASLRGIEGAAKGALASSSAAQAGLIELQRRADAAQAIYLAFLNRSKETAAAAGVQQADTRVLSYAEPPVGPSSPKKRLVVIAALALGTVSGAAVVLLLGYLETGVRTGTQVEEWFGEPFWAAVPELSKATLRGDGDGPPVAPHEFLVANPLSVFAEAFRNLRASLTLGGGAARSRVVALTSALSGEGKSATAYCLLRTFAQSGARAVLLDCDLRHRSISVMAGQKAAGAGLLEVLRGEAALDDVLVADVPNAAVLPSSERPLAGEDLFGGKAMDALLATLRERFDYVILDTAPTLAVADTRILAAQADVLLFLVRWGSGQRTAINAALQILRDAGAPVGGIALTRVDLRRQSSYGPGDASYYLKDLKSYYR